MSVIYRFLLDQPTIENVVMAVSRKVVAVRIRGFEVYVECSGKLDFTEQAAVKLAIDSATRQGKEMT